MSNDARSQDRPLAKSRQDAVGEDGAFLYAVPGMPMERLHRVFYLSVGLRHNARLRVAHFRPNGHAIGTLVLMQGRAEFIEKYADVIARYVRLGFCVVAFDWRGQGLSTRICVMPAQGPHPRLRCLCPRCAACH